MNIFLILIVLIYNKIPMNLAFSSSKTGLQLADGRIDKDSQSQRFRRDSPLVTNRFVTIPAYRQSTNIPQSSAVFCSSSSTAYPFKSIVMTNIGSINAAALSLPDQPDSIILTSMARGILLDFDNPPMSQCYLIRFASSQTSGVNPNDLNNIEVQFIYDSNNVQGGGEVTRSVGTNNGYGGSSSPYTSNTNSVCGSVMCRNGGICQYMGASGYQCQCDSSKQWLGNDCSKSNPCISSPCQNRGQCYYLPDATYYCVCSTAYSGNDCQYSSAITPTPATGSYNPCLSGRPCQNGGTCLPQGNQGGYTCTCPRGYTGVTCQSITYSAIPATAPPSTCGASYDRIVGGTMVKDHSWPWIVSLQTMNGGFHFCGGTLIDALHVVTAAHCFDEAGTSPNAFQVVAGLLNMQQTYAAGVQHLAIDRIFRHEQYSSKALVNDITVIKLRTPAQFTEAVSPICLPSGNGAQDPQVGDDVKIAGWGYTNSSIKKVSNQLQQATIKMLDFNGDLYGGPGCNTWSRRGYSLSSSRQICAMSRDTHVDSCQGDSGGPLIGEVGARWYLFGIVSYGDSVCASSTAAGVYTRVSAYATWIQQKLQL